MLLLTRFLHNGTAGAAPLLRLCIIPLVGAAIDFSRAASVRTSMQMALDPTTLMPSKEAQGLGYCCARQQGHRVLQCVVSAAGGE
jgi:hypothetical protein